MKPVTPDYDRRTIPRCETSAGPPVGDAIGAVLLGLGGVVLIGFGKTEGDEVPAWIPGVGFIVAGGILALIARAGFGWNSECQQVKRDWDVMQIEQDTLVRETEAKAREIPPPVAAPPDATPIARGFFCSSSLANTAAGFCVRDKAECQRTRDVSIAALPDLAECTLTEQAWCTGDLCFPNESACDARRQRTGNEVACAQRD